MIIKVDNLAKLNDFLNLPSIIYEKDPNWVKPLVGKAPEEFNPRFNPGIKYHDMELFLVEEDGARAGRVAAFVDNQYNQIHQEKNAFFGFFECVDDISTAGKLLSAVESFAKARKMKNIIGPVDFSTNYQFGFLVDGFSRPTVMTPYNKPFYPQLVESAGYSKRMDLFSYYIDKNKPIPKRLLRAKNTLKKRRPEISIQPLSNVYRLSQPQVLSDLYNKSFSGNWGYIPMSTKEFVHFLGGIASLGTTDLNYIAFEENKPVGLLLTVPDVYAVPQCDKAVGRYVRRNQCSGIRISVLGVLPSYRNRAIEVLLSVTALEDAFSRGYERIEFSVILETNIPMVNFVNREFNLPVSKTYRVYQKQLT